MKKVKNVFIGILAILFAFIGTFYIVNLVCYNKHYRNATVEQKTKHSFYNIKAILTKNPELLDQVTVVINKTKDDEDETVTVSKANKLWDDNYYVYIKIPYGALDNFFHYEIDDFFSNYRHSCGCKLKCYIQIEYVKGRSIKSSVAKDFTATGVSSEDILFTRHNIYDVKGEEIYNVNKDITIGAIKAGQDVILGFLPTFRRMALKSNPAMW